MDDEDLGVEGMSLGGDTEVSEFPSNAVMDFGPDDKLILRQKKLKKSKSGGFESLGLSLPVFRGVKRKGYQVPTPIQRKTMPLILAGHDVVAMARTGSGKTAAFLIPLLEKLKEHSSKAGARAVILSPTRELALQTHKFCREIGRYTDLVSVILVGGDSMEAQFDELAKNPDIIIATPGRLMHHLSEVEGMSLARSEYVVFDEADRLFEMGFAEQLRQILRNMNDSRQTLLFSATMPKLLAEFARAGLKDPALVRLDTERRISPDLSMCFFTVRQAEKVAALLYLLREVVPADQQTIVFVSTKHHVEYLQEVLRAESMDPSVVYGAMDQTARKIHIAKFRARKTFLLLVTDVAARGIDIPLLDNVINFDFPPKPKLFVHRVGRAARAGRTGAAYSLLTHDELPFLLDLHLFLSRPVRAAPTEEAIQAAAGAESESEAGNPVLQEASEAVRRGETVYGRLPQAVLDLGVERARSLALENDAIRLLAAVADKGFRLFVKTRPAASAQSVLRAKGLPAEGLHPMMRRQVGTVEAAAGAFAEHLKKFRPKLTVLEADRQLPRAGAASSAGQGQRVASEVMKRKRAAHSQVIETSRRRLQEESAQAETMNRREAADEAHPPARKQKRIRSSESEGKLVLPPGDFRDQDFFISGIPANKFAEHNLTVKGGSSMKEEEDMPIANQLDAEVLDLVPEDGEGVQQRKSTFHWDKKSKKYVKLGKGEVLSASGKVKTESGAKVNAGNRGIYKKWQEKTHNSVATVGEETTHLPHGAGGRGRGRGRGGPGRGGRGAGRAGHSPLPNADAPDELKSREQVRKTRQKEAFKTIRGRGRGRGGDRGRGRSTGPSRAGPGDRSRAQSASASPGRGGRGGGRGRSSSRGGRGSSRGGKGSSRDGSRDASRDGSRGGNSGGSRGGSRGASRGGSRGGSRGASRGGSRGGGRGRGGRR